MAFAEGESLKDIAVDSIEGGVASFVGIYAFDKFLAKPLQTALKSVGKYVLPASGLIADIVVNFISQKIGDHGVISEGLRVAGYSMLGKSIATFVGDPTPNMATGKQVPTTAGGGGWGSLNPVAISRGKPIGTG